MGIRHFGCFAKSHNPEHCPVAEKEALTKRSYSGLQKDGLKKEL